MSLRVLHLDAGPLSTWAAEQRRVDLTGVVTADPEFVQRQSFGGGDAQQVRVELRAERVESSGDSVDVRSPVLVVGDGDGWEDVRFGETVSVSGSLRPAPTDPTARCIRLLIGRADRRRAASRATARGRGHAVRAQDGGRRAPARTAQGLLPALVVGDTSAMPPLLTQTFAAAAGPLDGGLRCQRCDRCGCRLAGRALDGHPRLRPLSGLV